MSRWDEKVTTETPEKWTETPDALPRRPIALSGGGEKTGETGLPVNSRAVPVNNPVNGRDGAERAESRKPQRRAGATRSRSLR